MIFLRITAVALIIFGLVSMVQAFDDILIPTGIYPELRKNSEIET